MVINCPECSTKFRVSAEKIPAKGAKLRCARCRHIFFVKPETEPSVSPPVESPAPAKISDEPPVESPTFDAPQPDAFAAEEPPAEEDFAVTDNGAGKEDLFGDTDFGFAEPPTPPEEPVATADIGFTAPSAEERVSSDNIDFGFDEEASTAPESGTEESSSDAFGFDSFKEDESAEIGAGTQDEFDASAFADDTPASDDAFSFDEDYGNVAIGGDDDDQTFSFEEAADDASTHVAMSQPASKEEISTEEAAAGFAEEAPFAESIAEEPAAEPFAPLGSEDYTEQSQTKSVAAGKKRGPLATLILFLLVLILGIVVAGGVLYWQSGPEALQQIYQRLTGQEVPPPSKGQILVKNLQGSFVTNKTAGELLVIQGNAVNDYREARAAIQVKGILFDKQGNQLRQKTIFCGNPISTEDLRSLPYDKLEEIMGNQFGESLVNLNVSPGQVIPFTIVFRDIPENLSEFVVEVADSNPAAQ